MKTYSINDVIFSYRGKAFKEVRKNMKLTLQELSRKSGVSKAFISAIETGIRTPSNPSLRKLADALEVPVCYFDIRGLVLGKEHFSPAAQITLGKIGVLLEEMRVVYAAEINGS